MVFVVASDEAALLAANQDSRHHAEKQLQTGMQNLIKKHLNPLFHIWHVALVAALPRTASNKIMRRVLRDQYVAARKEQQAAAQAAHK